MTKKSQRAIITDRIAQLETEELCYCNSYDAMRKKGYTDAMLSSYLNVIERDERERRRLNGILGEWNHLTEKEIEERLNGNQSAGRAQEED